MKAKKWYKDSALRNNIICTIGPASKDVETLTALANAGMSMARLNFSHGTYADHLKAIEAIRKVQTKDGRKIKILQDLEGYRIRLGFFREQRKFPVVPGQKLILSHEENLYKREPVIPFDYSGSFTDIVPGADIYVDDGKILLRSLEATPDHVRVEVIIGGDLKSHKGVNIPNAQLQFDLITEKDRKDIAFGIEHKVDYIAQSFVRNRDDVRGVREILNKANAPIPLIAKIENQEGVDNIQSIINEADAIMVARGDLGVSLPMYKVPIIQKQIIAHCNEKGKMVITATQMLESMTYSIRPTRAEVADVANAILDGTDYVMLSGETAVGQYPVQTVEMMSQIIHYCQGFKEHDFKEIARRMSL